ncbi:MAG: GlxA family transcriptional regulator [Gammaproteobacteria bacterium]|nr:GlxA family transcriptional regulator [Gammaproteobacteria bacterium]
MDARAAPRKIGLLLLPQFFCSELGLITEPLVFANWLVQRTLFEWTTLSLDGHPVAASNGIQVAVDGAIANDQEFFAVFVLAGFESKTYANDKRAKDWLRRQSLFGAALAGVQMGSEILAAAGLLSGCRAAVHWDNLEGFRELYPKVDAKAELFAIEPRRLTCAGVTSVTDMMLHWLNELVGTDLVREVSQHMLVTKTRPATESQLSVALESGDSASPQVLEAITIMQRTLEDPICCDEIARMVGLSRRQLERHFKQYTTMAPQKYYIHLRLSKAHRLLQQTNLSVAQVSACTGFDSLEHFSRVYRQKFGRPPSTDRLQSTAAPVMRQIKTFVRK